MNSDRAPAFGAAALQGLREPDRTYARCWDAVGVDGGGLLYVPVSLRDAALCQRAVDSWPGAFVHVPFAVQSEGLFWRALLPLYDAGQDEVVVAISQALAPHLRTAEALQAMIDIAPEQAHRIVRSTDCAPVARAAGAAMGG
ncbi:hypothetical protein [Dolichospermum phage Dfl-JY45]